jgi:HSP20 family molecular chaperone IbpA
MLERNFLIPAVDIYEGKDRYRLVLDMPGTSKEDIEINAENENLQVIGKVRKTDTEWAPIVSEFELLDYKREFGISNKINREKIAASYENGILTIELEKSETAKPRKIEVKAA